MYCFTLAKYALSLDSDCKSKFKVNIHSIVNVYKLFIFLSVVDLIHLTLLIMCTNTHFLIITH